jgi:hypothetical protein
VLIDDQWATHEVEHYRISYRETLDSFRERGATIIEVPTERERLRVHRETKRPCLRSESRQTVSSDPEIRISPEPDGLRKLVDASGDLWPAKEDG